MNRVILFLTLISYSFVVSQSLMYILALKNTQLALGGSTYVEVRQLIDANMKDTFKYAIYSALLFSLLLVLVNLKSPTSLVFIMASIGFLALIVDVAIMIKGNMPLNTIINTWSPENYPANWKEIRQAWFSALAYRQVANGLGFLSLLIAAVFGK